MTLFFARLSKEITITLETLRESIITIAERVDRKVRILSFHWETAKIHDRIDHTHRELGTRLSALLSVLPDDISVHDDAAREAEMALTEAGRRIDGLKRDALGIDTIVHELEMEALREDLITLQHDFSSRDALIRRVVVERTAIAVQQSVTDLRLPPTVRVGAILRGPLLLVQIDQTKLRPGDIIILLGSRGDLQQCLSLFSHAVRTMS